MSEIKIIRLFGIGDDIICRIQRVRDLFKITDALVIRAIPNSPNNVVTDTPSTEIRIAMAPFLMPYMKNEPFMCGVEQVVYFTPTDEVIEKYKSIFSPIVKPNLQIIKK